MIWQNWNEFFAMGGYAFYVWGSLFVVIGCMVGEIVLLRLRTKAIKSQFLNARLTMNLRTKKKDEA